MKNVRYQPNNPTETRTIQARTQSTKTIRRSGDEQFAPEYSYLNWYKPRQPKCPAAADSPGWMRWSPEDGEGGLRRVLLPRPLVRRKATIKSTRMTWYSPLVKPERKTIATRSFLIKNIRYKQTASQIGKGNKPTASQNPRRLQVVNSADPPPGAGLPTRIAADHIVHAVGTLDRE